jgi:hypothetical protein
MKFFHNEKLALGWAIMVELVVHLLFAIQAFLLGRFIGEVALKSMFGALGADIGAWVFGIFVFGAAFQAFVLGEYMREHVESYETTARGDGTYIRSWTQLRWTVGGIEIASLLFRCISIVQAGGWVNVAAYFQAAIIAGLGALLLWYAYVQAKVIHASVNRPPEYDMMQAQASVGRGLALDSLKHTDDMYPEEKARFVAGDITAIQDVVARKAYAAQQEEQIKQSKEDARAAKAKTAANKAEIQAANAERGANATRKLFDPSTWNVGKPRPKADEDFLQAQSQSGQSLSNGHRN